MFETDPDYADRRERMYRRLEREGVDGYYTDHLLHLRYLCGFNGTAGSLLMTVAGTVLFLDGRYRNYGEDLEREDLSVRLIDGPRTEELAGEVSDRELGSLHFERPRISYETFREIVDHLGDVDRDYGEDWVAEQRGRKDAVEVECLREAVARTLDVFPIIDSWLEPGITENELSRAIRRELESRGEGLAFHPLVLVGERTANPHCPSSDRPLEPGDPLLVDMGLKVEGYCSDLTRMFFCGDGASRSRDLYELSKRASAEAFDGLQPGRPLAEVAARAHDLIREEGYGDHLRHGLGHGIGLNVHETPRLSEKADGTLEEGMIVTLEPGIYIDGTGGGRIEHMARITEEGAEILDEPNEYFPEQETPVPEDRRGTSPLESPRS